jgi:serine protease Do
MRRGGPRRHHEPETFLGVGVEEVPPALTDQLSLPEGFGVLVNFVMPGSAAAAAGVERDDVLKMLNDQILVDPEQLSTLVHNFGDGQQVTLTAIRKGKEVKLPVTLKKQDIPEGRERLHGPGREGMERGPRDHDMDGPEDRPGPPERDRQMFDSRHAGNGDGEGDDAFVPPGPPAPPVNDIMRQLRPELKQLTEDSRRLGEDARQRAADRLQREITILRERNGASRSTKLDIADARIVIRDDKGELVLQSDDGKRSLTAKDPQGKLLFSGPVNTPDERKAVPADILPRLDKLEKEEMPAFPEAKKPAAASISQDETPDGPTTADASPVTAPVTF